jgi:gamma-glutamyltranspeptidase/glutathione hydrolase
MYRMNIPAGIAGFLLLTGCSLFGDNSTHAPVGLAVGDEPVAVRAGATVLAEGGSAADAAAAMYFALSVTYPVAAGIGGGGICLIRDPQRNRDEEVDFLPRDTAHSGAYAVPGSVSGFAFIQSNFGNLPWQRVVSAGEGLASAGFPISHALSKRLADNQDLIRLDAGLAGEFLDESGNLKPEGSIVGNAALAQTLAAIRTLGPAGFYGGSVSEKLVAYSTSEGGAISSSDLLAYAPGHGSAMVLKVGSNTVLLPSRRVGAGAFLSAMWAHLVDGQGNVIAGDNLAASVATATKATLDEFHLASLPRDLGATGFAAIDRDGQAVSCAVTMNGPFGSGHTAAGTGITLARAPSTGNAGLAAAFLSPAISKNDKSVDLVGAGAGGPNGTAAIIYALLKSSRGIDVIQPGQLHSTGIEPYETINVIACPGDVCAAIPDPGASGLGAAGG